MTTSHQETLFDVQPPAAPEKRTDLDRLEMVYGELGFIPHSRVELNYATLALDNRDVPGGFARFLNEVLLHQRKSVSQDSAAALRSIVAKTKGFAETTRGDIATLGFVHDELGEYLGTQNFLELDNLARLKGWSLQPTTMRGLGIMTRHLAVKKAIADGQMVPLDGLAKEPAIAEMMAETRVYEADMAIDSSFLEADSRHDFWVTRIDEATKHGAVRPVAIQALRSLGIETEK